MPGVGDKPRSGRRAALIAALAALALVVAPGVASAQQGDDPGSGADGGIDPACLPYFNDEEDIPAYCPNGHEGELLEKAHASYEWGHWLTDLFPRPIRDREYSTILPPMGHSGVIEVADVVRAASLALLGLMLTFSLIHFLAAGTVGSGGAAEVTAPLRALGAGLFIWAWGSVIFEGLVYVLQGLADAITGFDEGFEGFHVAPALNAINKLFGSTGEIFEALPPGPDLLAPVFQFLLSLAVVFTILALSIAKLSLVLGSICGYIGVPIAVAAWVVPGMSWLTSGVLKATIGFMLVPVAWAIVLRVYSVLAQPSSSDPDYSWIEGAATDGFFVESMVEPLLGLMLLIFLFVTMRQVLRLVGVYPAGARPFSAAWGTAMGIGYAGYRAVSGGVRGAAGAVSRASERHERAERYAQQDARTLASDIRRGSAENQRTMDAARRQDQEASRQYEGVVSRHERAADDAERRVGEMESRWRADHQQTLDRAHGQAEREGRERLRWSPPEGANVGRDGLHAPFQSRTEAEIRGSETRLAAGSGSPSYDDQRNAFYALAPDRRQGVRELVHPSRPDVEAHPHPHVALAEAAGADGITPNERAAYRTLLDGANHVDSMSSFEAVASLPVEQVQAPPTSANGSNR